MTAVTMPFIDWMGLRSAEQLAELVTARRDLLHPPPRDVPGLAARAASQASAARARTFLDAPADRVLEAAVALSKDDVVVSADALAARSGYDAKAVAHVAETLVSRALLWPALTPDGAEDLGGWRVQPVLVPLDDGAPHDPPPGLEPPAPVRVPFPDERAEGFAAGNAAETLAQVGALLDELDDRPVTGLRQGGLSAKTGATLARGAHIPPSAFAEVIELAVAAGLIGTVPDPATPGGPRLWVPTEGGDAFRDLAPVDQWLALVDAWESASRLPGGDAEHPGRLLSPGAERTAIPSLRRTLVAMLEGGEPGTAEPLTSLEARLAYSRPRMWPRWEPLVDPVVSLAAKLGIVAVSLRGEAVRLSGVGATLASDRPAAATAMMALLPEPTTQVILESDLTAVVPGVAHPQVRRFLRRIATIEAGGQGTVFRFSAASVLAGLESGLEPQETLRRLAQVSAEPVPQALEYLVWDAARTLGRVALGRASAYVRADEPEQLDALMAQAEQGRLPGVALQRLAPTVLVTTAPLSMLSKSLADLGIAAHAEDGGQTIHGSAQALRADSPSSRHTGAPATTPDADEISSLAVRWAEDAGRRRLGRERSSSAPASGPADTPAAVVNLLTEAAASRRAVRATVIDRHGEPFTMDLAPRSVVGGRVRGIRLDADQEAEVTLVIHRIQRVEFR